jgi:hypothetical protein
MIDPGGRGESNQIRRGISAAMQVGFDPAVGNAKIPSEIHITIISRMQPSCQAK